MKVNSVKTINILKIKKFFESLLIFVILNKVINSQKGQNGKNDKKRVTEMLLTCRQIRKFNLK
jgi:hypothetical protein